MRNFVWERRRPFGQGDVFFQIWNPYGIKFIVNIDPSANSCAAFYFVEIVQNLDHFECFSPCLLINFKKFMPCCSRGWYQADSSLIIEVLFVNIFFDGLVTRFPKSFYSYPYNPWNSNCKLPDSDLLHIVSHACGKGQ